MILSLCDRFNVKSFVMKPINQLFKEAPYFNYILSFRKNYIKKLKNRNVEELAVLC